MGDIELRQRDQNKSALSDAIDDEAMEAGLLPAKKRHHTHSSASQSEVIFAPERRTEPIERKLEKANSFGHLLNSIGLISSDDGGGGSGKVGEGPGATRKCLSDARLRLVRRDSPFSQSGQRVYMRRGGAHWGIALRDLFHVVLTLPTGWVALGMIVTYTCVILLYAFLYMLVDGPEIDCGLGPKGEALSMYNAFAFSLETLTTIGFGIPYYYVGDANRKGIFNQCVSVLTIVYFEAMTFLLLNACFVGVLFSRISSASHRASQIVFSEKACIRCVRNRFYFMFQVGETSFIKYSPAVEARVRVYAVLHERNVTQTERAFFQTRVMRLTNPNDELGGMLFLATPQIISHRIDQWSPAFPPAARKPQGNDDGAYHFPGLVFREEDREVMANVALANTLHAMSRGELPSFPPQQTGWHERLKEQAATGWPLPMAGAEPLSYVTESELADNGQENGRASNAAKNADGRGGIRPSGQAHSGGGGGGGGGGAGGGGDGGGGGTGGDITGGGKQVGPHVPHNAHAAHPRVLPRADDSATIEQLLRMKEEIRTHISHSELEVIVLVEANDPHSGNPFQARHSYTARDIIFDKTFVPSMTVANDGAAKLDWSKFHEVVDVPFNSQMIGGSHS